MTIFMVDEELVAICREILAASKTAEEWDAVASDDMFQSKHYEGGFESSEQAFTFSRYAQDGGEVWFELTVREVQRVVDGSLLEIEARPAEL